MKKGIFIFLLLLVAMAGTIQAKGNKDVVYIMGASFSVTDSTVYFTEIQRLDGIALEDGRLPHRHYYSYELKDYMSYKENQPGRTSVIYFSKKRSVLEKKEMKMKERLIERERKNVVYLGDKFKFVKP
jgi:hypothetical protein